MTLRSYRLVWFVRRHPGGRCFRSRSSGSLAIGSGSSGSSDGARRVAGFVQVRLIPLAAPKVSLDSFRFVWFVRVRPGCRWVCSGLSGSSKCTLEVAWFIRVCMDRSRARCW